MHDGEAGLAAVPGVDERRDAAAVVLLAAARRTPGCGVERGRRRRGSVSQPGRAVERRHLAGRPRTEIQRGCERRAVEVVATGVEPTGAIGPGGRRSHLELERRRRPASRRPSPPARGTSPGRARGSRASCPAAAAPSSTIHHEPSGASTRSAWPVFWIGRSVLRWLRIGLAGYPSHGPIGRRAPGDRHARGPRSVPPSAISRYQSVAARRGAAPPGTAARCPTTRARGRRAPRRCGRRSGTAMPSTPARSGPSRCRRRPRRGRGRCRRRRRRPGPTTDRPGPSAVTKKLRSRRRACTTVVIIQNRPSWWRIVGAKTPADDEPVRRAAGRAATAGRGRCRSGSSRRGRRAEDRHAREVLEGRRDQVVVVADAADARVGVEARDDGLRKPTEAT